MKINKALAQEAKKKGICSEWFNRLQNTEDKDELLQMYIDGIDFCLSNEYPSLSFIRENFVGVMKHYGVFLDEEIKTENSRHVVALGKCTGVAVYTGFEVGQVFLKHKSKLNIIASGNSFVMVDVFDDTEIQIEAKDNAKVCVNHYGGAIVDSFSGQARIKIIKKHSKTY